MPVNSQSLKSPERPDIREVMKHISDRHLAACRSTATSAVDAPALDPLSTRFSGLLLETTGRFEIVLRYAVVKSVMNHFDRSDWCRAGFSTWDPDDGRCKNIREDRKTLKCRGREDDSDGVMPELTFNFRAALHGKNIAGNSGPHSCGRPGLGEGVRALHGDLLKIRNPENRIAHHEPVFAQELRKASDRVPCRLGAAAPGPSCPAPGPCAWGTGRCQSGNQVCCRMKDGLTGSGFRNRVKWGRLVVPDKICGRNHRLTTIRANCCRQVLSDAGLGGGLKIQTNEASARSAGEGKCRPEDRMTEACLACARGRVIFRSVPVRGI